MWVLVIIALTVGGFLFLKKDKEKTDEINYELFKKSLSSDLSNLFNNYRSNKASEGDIKAYSYHFYKSVFSLAKKPFFDLKQKKGIGMLESHNITDSIFYTGLYSAIHNSIKELIIKTKEEVSYLSELEALPLVDYLLKRNLDEINQRSS